MQIRNIYFLVEFGRGFSAGEIIKKPQTATGGPSDKTGA
jgi:hypothetical protein